tara:strand:+ start:156 stop:482 length:327 start_codon:yes stop_codon:yes gene_type:complete
VIEMKASKDTVLEAIYPVEDPELNISLVELGLIYDVRIENNDEGIHVEVDISLTSPGCPVAPEIMASVHRAALTADGVDSVHVNLVWSPRWDPKVHATEDALMEMGIF